MDLSGHCCGLHTHLKARTHFHLARRFLLSTLALREEDALPRHPWVGRLALGCCAGAAKCGLGRVEGMALESQDEHQRLQENPAWQRHSLFVTELATDCRPWVRLGCNGMAGEI